MFWVYMWYVHVIVIAWLGGNMEYELPKHESVAESKGCLVIDIAHHDYFWSLQRLQMKTFLP